MTGMDDLVTWLRDQLDVAEAEADAILTPPPGYYDKSWQADELRQFATAQLDEVDAKRRILDRYEDAVSRQQDADHSQIAAHIQAEEYQDWVLPLLALPFAGRLGYREEWRP